MKDINYAEYILFYIFYFSLFYFFILFFILQSRFKWKEM